MANASQPDIRDLIRKRASVKSKLTMFDRYVASCDETDNTKIHELRLRVAKMEKDFDLFESIQDALELAATDEEFETRVTERAEFVNTYYRSVAQARKLIEDNSNITHGNTATRGSPSSFNLASPVTVDSEIHVKVPTMHLPKFSGSYEAWPGFCDAFKSAIHENVNLRDAQKLIYLRSCLTGKAAEKIESLETTAANYSVAWNILQNYYDDPSVIISNRIQAFFELPSCTRFNVNSLGELVDQATKHYRALQALQKPFLEAFPIYAITSKLDDRTRLQWKEKISGQILPSMDELLNFLHDRRKLLETANYERSHKGTGQSNPRSDIRPPGTFKPTRVHSVTNIACHLCQGQHFTQACSTLGNATVNERWELIKNANLCTNCLRPHHIAKNCTASTCKQCKAKHHTLLHQEQRIDTNAIQANVSALKVRGQPEILLSTAVVTIRDNHGNPQPCRLLLDSGSQSHFLTEKFAKKLGLSRQKIEVPVVGINQGTTFVTSAITTQIQSRINQFNMNATFLIIPHVTEVLPSRTCSKANFKIPHNIPLADPNFNTCSEIDGLIGAELFLRLLCVGQFCVANNSITLQKTKLGWIVAGKMPSDNQGKPVHCNLARDTLQEQLTKFWQIEEPPRELTTSPENQECERHFKSQVSRDPTTGRYTVRLPFRKNIQGLGESYSTALKRYYALERRFLKNPELKSEYTKFLNEYQELGHMAHVESPNTEEGYYLPHHAILKQSSLTTRLRVVFDASAKTTNGMSLNDTLLVGPTIQDELLSTLIRFRSHPYVITADIEKMYRQVLIHPDDRKYQKILWRSDVREPIKTYSLNTITYGTSAAPFLAIRTLHQLAIDEGNNFPQAATVLREDFYVDDLLTGARTYDETVTIRDELISLCKRGGFKLRKWAANDETLIETLDNKTEDSLLRLDLDETVKTLGVSWNAKQDVITYEINEFKPTTRITKRSMLSQIATLFDPLGILGPIIIRAKIMMQTLWKLQLTWDESVPLDIHTKWTTYCRDLPLLKGLKCPRSITPKEYTAIQLHGFCDSSEQAYGACIYLRATDRQGNVSSQLITSKSRVAPLKTITLPRLELCAAHLLTKLYKGTRHALRRLTIETVTFWTDSTIVLHWIHTSPHLLKTFVSHRITDIQNIPETHEWRHVRSVDNPADVISRGSDVQEFLTNDLWHRGPTWLRDPVKYWPSTQIDGISEIPEMRPLVALTTRTNNELDLFTKISSYAKLKRIVAYILRFRFNSSLKERHKNALTVFEIRRAEQYIVKYMQERSFRSDIRAIAAGEYSGHLASLNPFLDNKGIVRVGGRLTKARLRYDVKHPILLPKDDHVTRLIIREQHVNHLHAGTQATLNAVRQKFWIISGRNVVRKSIHKCVTCYRAKPSITPYKMGDLPSTRTTFSRPFLCTGVDFCGPILIKEKTHRNRNKVKVYLAIFICFATKAVHIEIVGDLTTEAFLAALRRFIARRGRCSDIYSDNATNFVGASKELKELYAFINSKNDNIASTMANENTRWHLIPPRSPHFGGLWEAAVRSTKHHLTRVIGNTLLSYEALLTYINQIEGILNSRPITSLSSDPNDLTALTPAHFLIGDRLTSVPEFDYSQIPDGRLSSWQHVQKMKAHFWKRWHHEYLHEQTTRKKWHSGKTQNITIGTMVLLKEDNTPPMTWPLGRIVAVHPGDDGIIRVVTVKTAHGEYKRCVKRIAPLPISDDKSS